MKTVEAKKSWGDYFSTRFTGELARRDIEFALAEDEHVVVDFSGVRGFSHSFADECFGYLYTETAGQIFTTRLKVQNLNDEMRAVLRFVLADRKRRTPA